MDTTDSTDMRAIDDATRESLQAAALAFERGEIQQRECSPGVWKLTAGRAS